MVTGVMLAGVLLPGIGPAQAQSLPAADDGESRLVEGYYAGITGMASFQMQTDIVDSASQKRQFDFSPGFGAAAALGYQISEPWRIEAEISHRVARVASIIVDETRTDKGDGLYQTTALMLNGYLDIGRGGDGDIQPYIGVGVGGAHVRTDGWHSPQVTMPAIETMTVAYQLMGGVSYRLSPTLKLSLDYRYFGTSQIDAGVRGPEGEAELENQNHNVGLSLRYYF